jgi:hypothetical protein
MNQQMSFLDRAQIAFYLPEKNSKKNYKRGQKALGWAGMSMIRDALLRRGNDVDFCDKDSVTGRKIILVSLTSAIDWYEFIKERIQWEKGDYTVVVGGPGLDNIRPFLEYADIFVWGRAEDIIVPLLMRVLMKRKYEHPSVCYSEDFSVSNRYEFKQSEQCYPEPVPLSNGNRWIEQAIGCKQKCLFCNYSWTRTHVGGEQSESGASGSIWGNSIESSIFQLDLDSPESWPQGSTLTFGLDGMSERLRRMVNKPISREMLEKFIHGLGIAYGEAKAHKVKIYNIVGLPTETKEDWFEMAEIMYQSSPPRVVKDSKITKVQMHHTPFKPPPCTPVATWPVSFVNYRDIIVPRLQHENCKEYQYGLYAGTTVDFNSTYATESVASTAMWMLTFRGVEQDAPGIREIATSSKFNSRNTQEKMDTLNRLFDTEKIFGCYTWDKLPTKYLHTHTSYDKLESISDHFLRKFGGSAGEEIALTVKGK